MSNLKTYLIIILLSTTFTLYLFETYLNLSDDKKNYNKIKKIYFEKTGKNYDERTMSEIYKDLKKLDEDYVVSVFPITSLNLEKDILPLSGISNKKTIHCNENGYYSIYMSDRFGFNNPDDEWNQTNIEYLLVGDSFTHGACVNRPNDIGSVLRKLSDNSVLNLGYGGNGPLIQYATLKEYLQPGIKNILWLYYEGNDLEDLKLELKNDILVKYLKKSDFNQNLKMKQAEIDKINISRISKSFFDTNFRLIKKDAKIKYKILKFLRLDKTKSFFTQYLDRVKEDNEKPIEEFGNIIEKVNNLAITNNSKLYFIFLPNLERYKFNRKKDENKIIKKILHDLNISYIDIDKEVFQNEDNKLMLFPFEFEAHYTIEGYYKVANSIHEIVSRK